MSLSTVPTFQELELALSDTAMALHPSEVHGLICGAICGQAKKTAAWEMLMQGGEVAAKVHDLLKALFDASVTQMRSFDFDFELLLPEDDVSLSVRAEALTLWCQGFLTGLQYANVPIEGREPSETTEVINDMIEIAKMNFEDVVTSEEDESAYIELVEYVRMAATLIYQDTHQDDVSSTTKTKHLH